MSVSKADFDLDYSRRRSFVNWIAKTQIPRHDRRRSLVDEEGGE
jgi:hypothetical protein